MISSGLARHKFDSERRAVIRTLRLSASENALALPADSLVLDGIFVYHTTIGFLN